MKLIIRWLLLAPAFLMAVFYGYGGTVTTDNLTVNQTATFYGDVNMVLPGTVSSNGLVLYYNYDTNTTPVPDLSGNNNTGIVNSAIWTNNGKVNGAYDFNGTSGWIKATNTASINMSTALTVTAWICPDISNSCMNAVSKSTGNGGTSFGWLLDIRSSRIYPVIKNVSGTIFEFAGATVLPTNQWSHIAVTYDGTNLTGYLNGLSDGTISATGLIDVSGNYHLGVGWLAQSGVAAQYFNGRIDEVRLYNRALTPGEVNSVMLFGNEGVGRLTVMTVTASNSISQSSVAATNTFMGKVGIGTNNATEMLDVNGNAVVRGTISGNGSGLTNVTASAAATGSTLQADVNQGKTAYGWGNHATNGYLSATNFYLMPQGDISMGDYTQGP